MVPAAVSRAEEHEVVEEEEEDDTKEGEQVHAARCRREQCPAQVHSGGRSRRVVREVTVVDVVHSYTGRT